MFLKWFVIATVYVMLGGESAEAQQLKDHYHQTDYILIWEIVEIVNVNETYLRNYTAGLHWHNRTTRVGNGHGTLIKDIDKNYKLEVQVWKFLSNEYRFFPITIAFGCNQVAKNTFGILELLVKYSNIPMTCRIPKGYYYIKNAVYDCSKLPPYIPFGRYKLEAKLYSERDYVATLNVYVTIDDINNWQK